MVVVPSVMAAMSPTLFLRISALAVFLTSSFGNYIITTPRKWTSGERVQVCVFVFDSTSDDNSITVAVKSSNEEVYLVPNRIIHIPPGKTSLCDEVFVPAVRQSKGKLEINGSLGGEQIYHRRRFSLANSVTKTFIQTDKFLYKPGQDVKFRILTLTGPFLKISTNKYSLIWIETPSGSRIAQWREVDNSAGLIHRSFKLSNEPEEGAYKIYVRPQSADEQVFRTFKVEEYVLPRFEVTVNPPKYILGTDTKFNITVCAKYTYGQPVKGNVTLEVDNNGWGSTKVTHTIKERISGCKDVTVLAEDVKMNGDDYFVYNMAIKATVVEDGTAVEYHGEARADVHRTALKFISVGTEEYLKPNLPFTGKVKAVFPDGSPAAGELMEVCAEGICKNMTTSPRGILEFIITSYTTNRVQIKAILYPQIKSATSRWRYVMFESKYHHTLKKYFSPSNSSLVIRVPEDHLVCHSGEPQEHFIPVLYAAVNQTKANITIQVVSRGQIQFSRTEEYELHSTSLPLNEEHVLGQLPSPSQHTVRGIKNLLVRLPPTASPKAKVVVWYIRENGEVVSDTKVLKIQKCFTNRVSLVWSNSKVEPGKEAHLNLSAEPHSLCSLGVVDKSVELLSSSENDLTVEKVFTIVEQAMVDEWEHAQSNDFAYCQKMIAKELPGPPGARSALYSNPSGIRSSLERLYAPRLSDDYKAAVKRSVILEPLYSDYVDALRMFDKSGLFIFTDLTTETRPCKAPGAYHENHFLLRGRSSISATDEVFDAPPSYDYDSYMDSIHMSHSMVESKRVEDRFENRFENIRKYFPETWLWKLSTTGLSGVRSEQLTLPDTITEWVGKAVCVHLEKGFGVSESASITTFTPFFVDLTLPPSMKRGEILPVKISVFNYLEEALPVKVVLEESSEYLVLEQPGSQQPLGHHSSCIQPQDKVVHTVKIQLLAIGNVNITVRAFVDEVYPEVCGPEYIISKRDHLIRSIKVEAEGFPREKTWTKYICSKDINENEDFLDNWVIETPQEIVSNSAKGWITAVGDLLGPTLENLGSLIRMPYGCGEQNMLNFAPNIFILQYLEASNQTTHDIGDKAVEFMKQGYQRELRYRRSDGSFSAFGNSDEFGSTWLTAFVLKSFAQARQFIEIDEDDLEMSSAWLKGKQMENGCFSSNGKILHKAMMGGIDDDDSPVPLTAYVLISLLEAGEPSSSKAVSEAVSCLRQRSSQELYTLALKAYALALSGVPEAKSVMEELISQAVETSSAMYWELPAGASKSDAVAVETAGYAILAMMTMDVTHFENKVRKIVKWISSKRNGQGGFISTQDTVVALQALASFEAHQDQGNVDLVVLVTAEGLEHEFHIDESNKLLQQRINIPSFPVDVTLDMEGQGCALVQAVLRYNVPDPSPSEAFSLTVNTETAPDSKCVTKRIKACASYQLPDQKSNMALIEVVLVSGYIPEKADLKQIVGYGTGLIKRYEVDGNKVSFYIEEFSPENICVNFRVIREIDVEDVKAGSVKVYDYYQPEFSVSQSYSLPATEECLFSSAFPIDEIIVEPLEDYFEEYEELLLTTPAPVDQEATASPASVHEEAIDDLIAALDDFP